MNPEPKAESISGHFTGLNKDIAKYDKSGKNMTKLIKNLIAQFIPGVFFQWYRIRIKITKEKIQKLISIIRFKLWPTVYNYFIYYKKLLISIIVLEIKIFLVITYLLVIGILTYLGYENKLGKDYDQILMTLASIIGTIIAIFFSLIVLPIQHIASKYSPKFLKFIVKDFRFWVVFIQLLVALFYFLTFSIIGSSKPIIISSLFLFAGAIFGLLYLVVYVIKISNPLYSILTPSYKKITKTVSKAMPKIYKKCRKKEKQLYKKSKETIKDVDFCKFSIDESVTEYIKNNLLPIREVIAKSIRDYDLENATHGIKTMTNVIIKYFQIRQDYKSQEDPVLHFIYEELKIISGEGNDKINIRLHPIIIESYKNIALQVCFTKVHESMGGSFNTLVTWPVQGLKDLLDKTLNDADSYAPSMVCSALGDIGVSLMQNGFDNQAEDIVKILKDYSILAIPYDYRHIIKPACHSMSKIYFYGVMNQNKLAIDPYNITFKNITDHITEVLGAGLKKTKLSTLDNVIFAPFIGSYNPFLNYINFVGICEYGIFNEQLKGESISKNLDCIKLNIDLIVDLIDGFKKHSEWYFSNQAIEVLYKIFYCLTSFINLDIAKDHIIFYKKESKIQINNNSLDKAEKIIEDIFSNLCKLVDERHDRYIYNSKHLHTLTSIYLIILYENKIRSKKCFDKIFSIMQTKLENLLNKYNESQESSHDDFYKYMRLIRVLLERNNQKSLADRLNIPKYDYSTARRIMSSDGQYPRTMYDGKWIILRPGFQANTYYFNDAENALGLEDMKFY